MPPEEAIAAWTKATRPIFDVKIRNPDTYSASAEAYLLGDLIVTLANFKAQTFYRRVKHTRLGAANHLVLELFLMGNGTGCLGDDFIAMSPYQVNLLDYRKTLSTCVEDASLLSITIPRKLIHSSCIEYFSVQSWHINSPHGRLLASMIETICQSLPEIQQKDAEAFSAALLGLLNGLLTPKQQRTTFEQKCVQASTLTSMKAFIDSNLHQLDLGIQELCKAFNCSRATVYRCFKEESGVESYIRSQRLKRAFHHLSTTYPATSKTPIYNIALECGFADPAYFSRLFKQTFGLTPSDVFHSKPNHTQATPVFVDLDTTYTRHIETFRNWMCTSR
ncbi:MAG: helix-turn-helix transcriptional regulator [Leptolyngbya sp. SIO1E4]|nr:helix-turn-helix transcriptional regulator [Leptolyngbya sp. SIO1E4]